MASKKSKVSIFMTKTKKKLVLTKARRKELAKRYNASEEKVEEFAGIFEELDKDKKGILDRSTFLRAALKVGFALLPEHADMIIKMYTTAKAVGIDVDKFVITMIRKMKWSKKETKDNAKDTFKSFDTDGDGFLSLNELRQGMEKLGDPMTDEEAAEMMIMADTDKDGRVSYEEFLEFWKSVYG